MMDTDLNSLDLPPFPPMDWDDCDWWVGEISLSFGSSVGLNVTPFDPTKSRLPSTAQSDALAFQLNNGQRVFAAVLDALWAYYQRIRPRYIDYLGSDVDQLMPALDNPEALMRLIDLRQVHVHPSEKSGIAHVGLQFGCTWDIEHGLGVMMHNDRVVELGGAEVSFAWTPTEADNM
ncbi:MAG: hypothetical protein KDA86_19025 [Planctomycetaceae bacterium]|nr:hypothetical protein [Planctomycetaceae bacterium]